MCKNCYIGPNSDKSFTYKNLPGLPVRAVSALIATMILGIGLTIFVIFRDEDNEENNFKACFVDCWSWALYGNNKK
jgi:hypothetical protein